MHRSKLELYEDVLCALAEKPLTIDGIAYECNMDCVNLTERLTFLAINGLVQQKACKTKTLYALTKRGLAISKTVALTRSLEKLQVTVRILDNPLSVLPALSEFGEGKTKRTRRSKNY